MFIRIDDLILVVLARDFLPNIIVMLQSKESYLVIKYCVENHVNTGL
jgi:hypothetical protein